MSIQDELREFKASLRHCRFDLEEPGDEAFLDDILDRAADALDAAEKDLNDAFAMAARQRSQ